MVRARRGVGLMGVEEWEAHSRHMQKAWAFRGGSQGTAVQAPCLRREVRSAHSSCMHTLGTHTTQTRQSPLTKLSDQGSLILQHVQHPLKPVNLVALRGHSSSSYTLVFTASRSA